MISCPEHLSFGSGNHAKNGENMNGRSRASSTVCLCWSHPLVRSDFRRLLSGGGLRVSERRLRLEAVGEGESPRLPAAAVYVVEAQRSASLTETLVARTLEVRRGGRIVVVAEGFEQQAAFSLLRLGVKGLLKFDEASSSLRRAVKEVARGGFWVSRSMLSQFVDCTVRSLHPRQSHLVSAQARLSRREHQVCGLLLENLSNRDIATRLQISERTAKFHVSNLLSKYGLKRRADLVVMSYPQPHSVSESFAQRRSTSPSGG